MGLGPGEDPLAAPVGDRSGGLQEQQALLGRRRRDPPSAGFLEEVLVVLGRFEPQERELESVLPAPRLGVAGAHVAAGLGEDRHDVVGEVDRPSRRDDLGGREASGRGHDPQQQQRDEARRPAAAIGPRRPQPGRSRQGPARGSRSGRPPSSILPCAQDFQGQSYSATPGRSTADRWAPCRTHRIAPWPACSGPGCVCQDRSPHGTIRASSAVARHHARHR